MSSGASSLPGGPRTLSTIPFWATIAAVGVLGYILYQLTNSADSFLMRNRPTPETPNTARSDPSAVASTTVVPATGASGSPEAPSAIVTVDQAMADLRLAQARGQVAQARESLQRIKQNQPDWKTRSASMLSGDSGRRISGSPAHVKLAIELFDKETPPETAIESWERQLTALAAPLDGLADNPRPRLELTPDYTTALNDLGQQLAEAASRIEQRLLLLDALAKETSSLPPSETTLEEAIRTHEESVARAEAERLAAVREKARSEAEALNAARIAKLEKELADAEAKRHEEKLTAERERVEAATRRAILEREFERDLPSIESYLVAFTADGYQHRGKGKGPMSLANIRGSGALETTQEGRGNLYRLANDGNDRPRGSIPVYNSASDWPHLDRAQELLNKYGELMVEKQMLDP